MQTPSLMDKLLVAIGIAGLVVYVLFLLDAIIQEVTIF